MDGRYIDFDAARAERKQEPLRLRAFGQEFELPGSMPASLFLDVVRMEREQGGQSVLTTKDAIRLLSRVLPEDVLDSLVAQPGFTLDDLIELARMVMAAYTGAGSGEAPAPHRAARRAK
jgi:aminoglycoside phosphotransferase family enzyme